MTLLECFTMHEIMAIEKKLEKAQRLADALRPFCEESKHWSWASADEKLVEHFLGYAGELRVGDLRNAVDAIVEWEVN
jgi:hypothetical protein